jgi:hypothetical protein
MLPYVPILSVEIQATGGLRNLTYDMYSHP